MSQIAKSLLDFASSPMAMAMMALGTTLGILVGAMPGLTGAMLIALALPLTFSLAGEHALTLLVAMYVGSVSGGLVTATLLKIPGTPASMMTMLDGYPLAQAGQARRALGLGIGASLVGGIVGWLFLVILAGPLARLSLQLGPFEFFSLVMVALVLISRTGGDSILHGLFAGSLGILLSIPGTNPATGIPRWTGGIHAFEDGLKLLPVLIGLFAISQVIELAGSPTSQDSSDADRSKTDSSSLFLELRDYANHAMNLIRSSLIGVFIGILPGIGANIGSVVSYTSARSLSKRPDDFGHGSEEGIVASEAANNATVGGALIPLIAMGIPGSVIDAILLGALTVHGLQPGPLLMEQQPDFVQQMMATILFANAFMFVFMLVSSGWLVRLASVPSAILLPIIVSLCVVGSYALANRMFDVWVMLAMGGLGLLLRQLRVPLPPLVIGFVLAPIAETHLVEGLTQSGGSWLPLVSRPICVLLLVVAGALFFSGLHASRTNPPLDKPLAS